MKKTLFLMLALIFTISLVADIAIGDGAEVSKSLPIEPFYGYSYSQMIYTQSEINTAGDITTLTFDFAGTALNNSKDWVIYMGLTDKTQFDTATDWIDVTTLTEVFNGAVADSAHTGALTIDITDFNYDNTANLVIAVDENTDSYNSSSDDFYCTAYDVARSLEYHNDSTNPDPAALTETTGTLRNFIANVVLGGIAQVGFPDVPANPVPADLAGDMPVDGDVTWDFGANVLTYDVKFGPVGDMTEVVNAATVTDAGVYSYTGLESGSNYQWQIVVHNDTRVTVEGPVWNFVTSYTTTALPIIEDFETDLGSFGNAVGNGVDWALVDTLASTGSKAVINAYDSSNNNILAVTSTIDFTTVTNPVLMFDHIAKTEGGYDDAFVEISVDGGATWAFISAEAYAGEGIYTENLLFNEDSYADWGTVALSLTNEMFKSERFNLDEYATATSAMIRFRLETDSSVDRKGWVIDNLYIGEAPAVIEGTVSGTVTLNDGEGVVTDVVIAIDGETVSPATDGTYAITLEVGTYEVAAALAGYTSFSQSDVVVTEDNATVVDFALDMIVEDLNAPTNPEVNPVTAEFTWTAPSAGGVAGLEEGFETWPPAGWLFTDADGDGYEWSDGSAIELVAHTGVGVAYSASYDNTAGALTPDNWLISPAVTVGANANVNYWVAAQDNAWAGEHYGVYVSTTGTEIADFELVFEETMVARAGAKAVEPRGSRVQGTWYEKNVDLSAYTGDIYVAFRHFNVTDMFYLDLDDVTISSGAATRELTGYEVFLDGASVANVTDTNYTFSGLTYDQEYVAGVTAVYDNGTSEMVTYTFTYTEELDLDAPSNLSADEVTGNLTWTAPGAGGVAGLEEGFETWPPAGWMFTDADADGYQWDDGGALGLDGHTGLGLAYSASYDNTAGALNPDNWLISPAVTVGANANVNYWVAAQDDAWAGEHYGVYVSTTGTDVADFELVFEETMVGRAGATAVEPRGSRVQGTWYEKNVDLSAYTGDIYVAFRHFNVTDMFYLDLDDVTISSDATRDLTRDLTGYEVFLDGASVASVTETNHTLTGLVAGTTYEAGVTAVYDNGSSEMITVSFTYTPTSGEENNVTAVTALGRNYPNPFNPTTNISFSLKEAGNVTLEVYNAKGQKIKTLVNGEMTADNHVVTWNGDDNNGKKVSSGIYFYKMHSKKYSETKKMLMIK